MKLRGKFALSAVILIVLIISGVAFVLYYFVGQILIKEINNANIKQVKALSQVARESIVILDDLLLFNYLKLIKSNEETAYATFLSKAGVVMAHTDVENLGQEMKDDIWQKISNSNKIEQNITQYKGKEVIDLSAPVEFQNEIIGYVRLGLLKEIIDKNIQKSLNQTRDRILLVAVAALLFGLFGSVILAQTMTKPIRILAQGAAQVGEGKLDTVINIKRKDELGELAQDFNQMAQQLKQLDRMKEDFMSSVTHELRSPLTAIKGYINLMLEGRTGPITPKQKEFLTIVSNNTARLGRFINDILDLAKIEAGMMEVKPEPVNVYEPANEVWTLMKSIADEKKINLILDVPQNIPPIMMDKDRIVQVITNLVSNALKFTPENGKITIRCVDKGDEVQFGVSDTGIGIPKEALSKLFSKFEQVSEHRKKVKGAKGTGLGLAIAKGLVMGHGGKIWVESEVNKGTTFYFTLSKKGIQAEAKGIKI